ncbi:MAG: flagellum-specific ATP synthase FliI, partial [Sideroxydans sp.]
MMPQHERWQTALRNNREAVMQSTPLQVSGRLTKVTGLVMEAVGLRMAVGSTCWIELPQNRIEAEVVGFAGDRLFLMPENDVHGLLPGARVVPAELARAPIKIGQSSQRRRRTADLARHLPVGEHLLGRVLDGAGR